MTNDLLSGKSQCKKGSQKILLIFNISSKDHNDQCNDNDKHNRSVQGCHVCNGIALIDRHRNSCIGGCCQIACDHIFFIELFPHLFGIVFLVLNRIISGLFGINLIIFLIIYYHNRKFFIVNVTG